MKDAMERGLAEIRRRIEELNAHPEVHVIFSEMPDGCSASELTAAEAYLGPLPTDLKTLYSLANGISIVWSHPNHKCFGGDKEEFAQFVANNPYRPGLCDFDAIYDLDNRIAGSLVIPSLKQIIDTDHRHWIEDGDAFAWSGDENLPAQVREPLGAIPLDTYYFFCAAAATWSNLDNAEVLLGDDHQACFSDYRRATTTAYLDLVGSQYFTIGAREELSMISGGAAAPILEYEGQRTSLKQVLLALAC